MSDKKVYVIPCSGIGKASASVGRDATYRVVEDLLPDRADTLCLALLTLEDEEAREKVRDNYVVAIDGCAKDCARKNVEAAGRAPDIAHRVQDYLKKHKDLKPEAVLDVGEGGRKLVEIMSEELAGEIVGLLEEDD
ncbi:MAG: putative zinc-binding protein [Actinomycetota bacterium]|nr:putative zinc-binding protein [Actinomycetota bacterium]MDD5668345.1 putative zinc-binding protein [Actinomycetota bacterium]